MLRTCEFTELANQIVREKEEHDIVDLFKWKKDLEDSTCHCPSCDKERLKVENLIEQEVDRLNYHRYAY